MKILAIGNSFSQDATTYIEDIANAAGYPDVVAANLYIGGCPLSRHAENLRTNTPDYAYQRHGERIYNTYIREALCGEEWDVITLQQVSGFSGIESSFHPYLEEVYQTVRAACPNARIVLHRTWAYETGSSHPDFVRYDNNREKMDAAIEEVYQKIAEETAFPILPVGNRITELLAMPEFNSECGGLSLYRDRFHLSFTYGRYAAALVWLRCFMGISVGNEIFFQPDETEKALLLQIGRHIDRTTAKIL